MSPFSWQCQNPCLLSLAFIVDWSVVSLNRRVVFDVPKNQTTSFFKETLLHFKLHNMIFPFLYSRFWAGMKFKVSACNSRYTYVPRDLAVFCLQLWRYCLWSGGRCVLLRGRVRSPRAPISCWRRRKPSQRPEPRRCSARDVYHWKTKKEIDNISKILNGYENFENGHTGEMKWK